MGILKILSDEDGIVRPWCEEAANNISLEIITTIGSHDESQDTESLCQIKKGLLTQVSDFLFKKVNLYLENPQA